MFTHLPRPFRVGMVIPSNRDPKGWHFTFQDAHFETYHYRVNDYRSAAEAKKAMREFVKYENSKEL